MFEKIRNEEVKPVVIINEKILIYNLFIILMRVYLRNMWKKCNVP